MNCTIDILHGVDEHNGCRVNVSLWYTKSMLETQDPTYKWGGRKSDRSISGGEDGVDIFIRKWRGEMEI
jgi:hypothetical protein